MHAEVFQKSHKVMYDAAFAINPAIVQPSHSLDQLWFQITIIRGSKSSYVTSKLFYPISLMGNSTIVPCYTQLY